MSWQEVLAALERSLAEAEQRLAGDVWERPAASWTPPQVPLAPLSLPEAARFAGAWKARWVTSRRSSTGPDASGRGRRAT